MRQSEIESKYGYFARNVAALRELEGLSQAQLAAELNISQTTVAHIEDGQTKSPRVHVLCAIAEFFCVGIEDLLMQDLSSPDELEQAIRFMREQLTPEQRDWIIGTVKAVRDRRRQQYSRTDHESSTSRTPHRQDRASKRNGGLADNSR